MLSGLFATCLKRIPLLIYSIDIFSYFHPPNVNLQSILYDSFLSTTKEIKTKEKKAQEKEELCLDVIQGLFFYSFDFLLLLIWILLILINLTNFLISFFFIAEQHAALMASSRAVWTFHCTTVCLSNVSTRLKSR